MMHIILNVLESVKRMFDVTRTAKGCQAEVERAKSKCKKKGWPTQESLDLGSCEVVALMIFCTTN